MGSLGEMDKAVDTYERGRLRANSAAGNRHISVATRSQARMRARTGSTVLQQKNFWGATNEIPTQTGNLKNLSSTNNTGYRIPFKESKH